MNPYKVLQVDREAEPEVVEAAYKRLASKYHPDKNTSESATAKMQQINAAHEILKDPERRARYDRECAAGQHAPHEPTPEPPVDPQPNYYQYPPNHYQAPNYGPGPASYHQSSPNPPVAPTVEQVSNTVFRKVLMAGALVALLFTVPWLAVVGGCLWAIVWFFRKYPGPMIKLVGGMCSLVVAGITWFLVSDWQRKQRRKEEVERLDLPTIFADQLGQFRSGCTTNAARKAPELAGAYCSCLAEGIRTRFDMSPIHADSVVDYNRVVSRRFEAAGPGDNAQAACVGQVRAKTLPPATSTAKRTRPNNSQGLHSKPLLDSDAPPMPGLYSQPIGGPTTR